MAEEKTTVGIEFDLDQAKKDLKALNDQIKQLNSTTDDTEETVKALERQWDLLDTAIKAAEGGMKEFEVTSVKTGAAEKTLGKELKEITVQLQRMKLEGKEGTAEYQNLIQRAGQLKDAMGDTAAAINKTASDTSNLNAVLGAASAVSGGFGLAVSTMSLLGMDTDNVAEAQKKLMQAIALVNSVQQISNALNKDSALMVKLQAAAYKLLGTQMKATAAATDATSKSFKGLKAALVSTGVGALVVALGFAVSKLVDYVEKTREAGKASEEAAQRMQGYAKTAGDAWNYYTDKVDASKKTLKSAEDAVKDFGKTNEQLLDEMPAKIAETTNLIKSQQVEVDKTKAAWEKASKKEEEYYFEMTKYAAGSTERANAEAQYAKQVEITADAKKGQADAEAKMNELKTQEQQLLLKQKQLQKEVDDERIRKAKEYLAIVKGIDSAIKANAVTLRNQAAEFLKDDPVAYYKKVQENIALSEQEAYAAEIKRYNDQIKKLKKGSKEREEADKLHRQNMMIISNTYMKQWQDAQDQLDAFQDQKDKDEYEKAKKHQEDMLELYNQYKQDLLEAKYVVASTNIDDTLALDTEEINARYKAQGEALKKLYNEGLISKEEFDKSEVLLEQAKQQELIDIDRAAMDARVAIAQTLTNNITSALGDLFEENKEMQIATTVASTIADGARAFTSTLAQGGQFAVPLAISAAAAVAARGAAAIKKLKATNKKSQSVSGSESGAGVSTASSQPAINTGTSSVAQAIISRNAPVTAEATMQPVLVVDEVTYKQQQQNNVTKISTI